jgi:hypothetical protein
LTQAGLGILPVAILALGGFITAELGDACQAPFRQRGVTMTIAVVAILVPVVAGWVLS